MSRARLIVAAVRQALERPVFTGELREQLQRDPAALRIATGAVLVAERARVFASSFHAASGGEAVDPRRARILSWAIAAELGTQLGALVARARRMT